MATSKVAHHAARDRAPGMAAPQATGRPGRRLAKPLDRGAVYAVATTAATAETTQAAIALAWDGRHETAAEWAGRPYRLSRQARRALLDGRAAEAACLLGRTLSLRPGRNEIRRSGDLHPQLIDELTEPIGAERVLVLDG